MDRTIYVNLTKDELRNLLRRASRQGAQEVISNFSDVVSRLAATRQGVVDRAMLAEAFDVSQQTIRRWARRHDFREVDGPNRRRTYYALNDIAEKVRNDSE
jgi:predicted site-specific integrase-resolvase